MLEQIDARALFVVNLAPRKMRGVVSEGMLFDMGMRTALRRFWRFPKSSVPNGSRAG